MAVISIRLNDKEEKMLKELSNELELDTSALIKKSLLEIYEDLIDRKVIEKYEKNEKKVKSKFVSFAQILK